MTTDDVIEALGGWEGYSIEKIEVGTEGGKSQVWIELTPVPGVARRNKVKKRSGVDSASSYPHNVIEAAAMGFAINRRRPPLRGGVRD